jgi:hypothetical protein
MGTLRITKRMAAAILPVLLVIAAAGWAVPPWQEPAARFVHYLRASGSERRAGEQLSLRERVVYAYILARS